MSSLSSKKQTKTSRQVAKSNLFIRYLEETSAWKNPFEFVWPLINPNYWGKKIWKQMTSIHLPPVCLQFSMHKTDGKKTWHWLPKNLLTWNNLGSHINLFQNSWSGIFTNLFELIQFFSCFNFIKVAFSEKIKWKTNT